MYLHITIAIIAMTTSCKKGSDTQPLQVTFEAKSNSTASGVGIFIQERGRVTFVAKLSGLVPGTHAIHLHEHANCSDLSGSMAGGHWNPTSQGHGKWGSSSYHKGDIGNFTADANGNGVVTLITDQWCIGCGDPTKDIVGTALIVHAGTDDFTTQPAGNSGSRISCAAVIKH